jgi:hypothetical protein
MKALADLKRRQISTSVSAMPEQNDDFDYDVPTIRKPTRHRLRAVAPMEAPPSDSFDVDNPEFVRPVRPTVSTNLVIRPSFTSNTKMDRMTVPKLTTEEFIQVRLATVRESTRHCFWPSDVIATFAAADVIR